MADLKKILYVEDDEDIQTITKMALEAAGFELCICDNGRIALQKVQDFKPDLILLDVMMPELDGPNTFREMQKMPDVKDIPVVFMTAKVQKTEIQGYRDLGAIDVISKPFDPMAIGESLNAIWKNYETGKS